MEADEELHIYYFQVWLPISKGAEDALWYNENGIPQVGTDLKNKQDFDGLKCMKKSCAGKSSSSAGKSVNHSYYYI